MGDRGCLNPSRGWAQELAVEVMDVYADVLYVCADVCMFCCHPSVDTDGRPHGRSQNNPPLEYYQSFSLFSPFSCLNSRRPSSLLRRFLRRRTHAHDREGDDDPPVLLQQALRGGFRLASVGAVEGDGIVSAGAAGGGGAFDAREGDEARGGAGL